MHNTISKWRAALREREERGRRALLAAEVQRGAAYTRPMWLVLERSLMYFLCVLAITTIGIESDPSLVASLLIVVLVFGALVTWHQSSMYRSRAAFEAYEARWDDIDSGIRRSVGNRAVGVAVYAIVVALLPCLVWRVTGGRMICGVAIALLALLGPRAVCTYAHLRCLRRTLLRDRTSH